MKHTKIGDHSFRCGICLHVKPLTQRHGSICYACHNAENVCTPLKRLRMRFLWKRASSKRRGIPFELSFEQFRSSWRESYRRDAFTGQPMQLRTGGRGPRLNSPVLGRKNHNEGYSPNNVMWIRADTNISQGKKSADEFLRILHEKTTQSACSEMGSQAG
jgi:hypothetical protein